MSSIKSPQILVNTGTLMKITDSYSIDQEANRHFTRNTDKTVMTFLSANSIEDLIRKG